MHDRPAWPLLLAAGAIGASCLGSSVAQTALPSAGATVELQDYASGNPYTVGAGAVIDTTGTGGAGIAGDASQSWNLTNDGAITGAAIGVDLTAAPGTRILNRGTITGNGGTAVQTGAGSDVFTMAGGTVQGAVDQGNGNDSFVMQGGEIAGALQQGIGRDDFRMTGGRLGSLQQGDTRDTFFMSGGTIVGAFEDGDDATMTGGTIGRVDMKLDNNIFRMSGGTIQGNLVTAFGHDTVEMSDGFIGGNISVSGGQDSVTITGGEVAGEVRMSTGEDSLVWSGGGIVRGRIDLGAGNDTALLRNLGATLAENTALDGGLGDDTLTFDNTRVDGLARFTNMERIALQRASVMSMDADLVLGDSGTGGGTLEVDATSTLRAVSGVAAGIRPAGAGSAASVANAGTIDLTGGNARNRLRIEGDYIGQDGLLRLESVLGDDAAPADRLVVAGGRIQGTTALSVANLGGQGGLTTNNGIMLVEAAGGATSDAGAFAMAGPVRAGAYDYYLYRGGVDAGTEDNWYLRSSVPGTQELAADVPVPEAALVLSPTAALVAAPLPQASAQAVPIYRPEVPVYTSLAGTARELAVFSMGTFHDRQGEQSLLQEAGAAPATWARVYGEDTDIGSEGGAQAEFDGSISGVQLGQDLYAWSRANGHRDHVGAFIGYAHADGDIRGLTGGFADTRSGGMKLDGYSAGLYWTHIGPSGWYTDVVGMYTRLDADLDSTGGMKESTEGSLWTGSIEAGYPFALGQRWAIEPQAQFIAQHASIDDLTDDVSSIRFEDSHSYRGRIGVRFKGTFESGGRRIEPYLRANLWRTFSGTDEVVFAGTDTVQARYGSTALQWGLGVAAAVSRAVSVYASADYLHDISGASQRSLEGRLGVRITW